MAVGKGAWRIHQVEETEEAFGLYRVVSKAIAVECWNENDTEPKTWTYHVLPGEMIWLRLLAQEYREAVALYDLVDAEWDDAEWDDVPGYDPRWVALDNWLDWAREAKNEAEGRLLRKALEG